MNVRSKYHITQFAFMLLFASEFTFYLIILQTGIIEYHHSIISEIWMIPFGGILGILISIKFHKEREWLIPFLLFLQLLLSLHYAEANIGELFAMGLISGMTAPMLIARIDRLLIVVIALGLSYTYGTYYFSVLAIERTNIALFLSALALLSSFFSNMKQVDNKREIVTLYSAGSIFLWLLLDAALFETLSRDHIMHLWGEGTYNWNIILFHLLGLLVAYKARNWKYNNSMLLALFILTYSLYSLEWKEALSLVYPFVISYYNVIILRQLMRLPYALLAMMALSLWGASGLGLLVALNGSFWVAWLLLLFLILIQIQTVFSFYSWKVFENIWSEHMKFLLKTL